MINVAFGDNLKNLASMVESYDGGGGKLPSKNEARSAQGYEKITPQKNKNCSSNCSIQENYPM